MGGILVLAIAGGTWQWGLPYLLNRPWWKVETVDLRGCPSELHALLTKPMERLTGQPLYQIWWQRAQITAELQALPSVRTAQLHLGWPNRVALTVIPRRPLFVVKSEREYYPVDPEGVLVGKELFFPNSLPVVVGLSMEAREAGQVLPLSTVQPVLDCLAAAREQKVKVAHLILAEDKTMQLDTVQGERVLLGLNRDLSRKLGLFVAARQELQRQGKRFEYVDVSIPEVPVWKPRNAVWLRREEAS